MPGHGGRGQVEYVGFVARTAAAHASPVERRYSFRPSSVAEGSSAAKESTMVRDTLHCVF